MSKLNYFLSVFRTNDMSMDRFRCLKSCQSHDTDCAMETVKFISHTLISLTTFKELREPEGRDLYDPLIILHG